MIGTLHVRKRLTHKYRDSYRDLDAHVTLGTVKLGDDRMVAAPKSFDDGGVFVRLVELPAGLSRKQREEWRQAVAENLSKWGCSHEYDCCGCQLVSTRVYATNHARRAIAVSRVSYNY